jgi:hypothetical protein
MKSSEANSTVPGQFLRRRTRSSLAIFRLRLRGSSRQQPKGIAPAAAHLAYRRGRHVPAPPAASRNDSPNARHVQRPELNAAPDEPPSPCHGRRHAARAHAGSARRGLQPGHCTLHREDRAAGAAACRHAGLGRPARAAARRGPRLDR